MVDRIVIDASAAVAIIRRESEDRHLRALLEGRPNADRLVPWLFWYEVANVLARRYRLDAVEVIEGIASLDNLGLTTVGSDRASVLAAVALASERGLSVYDASYLALAERLNARILTLDAELVAAAGDRALAIGNELREARSAYQLRPWVRWRDLDPYLDAVREATIASAR